MNELQAFACIYGGVYKLSPLTSSLQGGPRWPADTQHTLCCTILKLFETPKFLTE